MDQPIWVSLLLSALAGLASGELAVIVPLPVPLFVKAGLSFGLAMAAYFAFYEGRRALEKLVLFVLVCASACPISAISAYFAVRFLTGGALKGIDATNMPAPALFFAGFIGASLVLVTGMFLFSPQEKDFASVIKVLVWSTCGGLLGLTEPLGGKTAVVFLAWPTGVGLALSAMLRMEGRSVVVDPTPDETTTDSPIEEKHWVVRIIVGAIIMCAIGFLGRIAYYQLKWAHMRTAMEAAQQKVISEMPSTQSLPPIVPVKLGDALILNPISEFVLQTQHRHTENLPMFRGLPVIEYYASYAPEALSHRDHVQIVEVIIKETPNLQWASYLSTLPSSGNYLEAPKTVTQVLEFGQKIVKDDSRVANYGDGIEYFHWPSHDFAVSVRFDYNRANEEFLRAYLQKYPSSW